MVRARSPLANVDGAANGVLVDAGEAGPFFFSGRGAGEAPTASRRDRRYCRDRARRVQPGVRPPGRRPGSRWTRADRQQAVSPWYLRFEVLDVPGVLAEIAGHLAEAGVSIESMIQRGRAPGRAGGDCHDYP